MAKANKYPCKNGYSKIYEQLLGGEWWAEWPFHPTRKWRFDYACPELKIAIEVDGGVFTGGRHSGGVGQVKDMEKMNHAASMQWLVFHAIPDEMFDLRLRELITEAIKERKTQKS
jgi:very-short-patch-repair endonuclease